MRNLICLFTVLLFLFGCSDDEPICDNNNCLKTITCPLQSSTSAEDSISTGWSIQHQLVIGSKYSVSVNPQNTNQIVYYELKRENLDFINQLFFYDKISKSKVLLSEGLWSKDKLPFWVDGFIYFPYENSVYKIKPDGSEFGQVIEYAYDAISQDSKLIILAKIDNIEILNVETNETELIENTARANNISISKDGNKLAFISENSAGETMLNSYDFTSKKTTSLFNLLDTEVFGTSWSSDNLYIYWSDNYGVKRINIQTLQVEWLINHNRYFQPFIDNENQLYLTKETAWKSGELEISIKQDIVQYDLNTCTETKVIE